MNLNNLDVKTTIWSLVTFNCHSEVMDSFSKRVLCLAHVLPTVFLLSPRHNQQLPVILQFCLSRKFMAYLHPINLWSRAKHKRNPCGNILFPIIYNKANLPSKNLTLNLTEKLKKIVLLTILQRCTPVLSPPLWSAVSLIWHQRESGETVFCPGLH